MDNMIFNGQCSKCGKPLSMCECKQGSRWRKSMCKESKQLHAEQFNQFYLTVATWGNTREIGVRDNGKWLGLVYLPNYDWERFLPIVKNRLAKGKDIYQINKLVDYIGRPKNYKDGW